MKLSASLLVVACAIANAHYTFPKLIAGGVTTADWQYVRMTANHFDRLPVMDVNSVDIRCNLDPSLPATQTMPVAAGSQVGFTASPPIFHSGPLQFYMAKVPSGQTAASWDGSGEVWFKIHALGPTITPLSITFPALFMERVYVTIPKSLPSGDYLLRVEHIGLDTAMFPGAEFFVSCAQITVTGGGSGNPGPLVSFPGAYSPTDPGIKYNIWAPFPASYTLPGPDVWSG
ncbi:hypothetical protein V493_07915 [Pseudogymnoascus sp. VKM F-4281 (FW-2241)]|nr:hypothetical protein V493_07915 [Pseudogymnoascus sp. VKM F-4281 (FW-2241)]